MIKHLLLFLLLLTVSCTNSNNIADKNKEVQNSTFSVSTLASSKAVQISDQSNYGIINLHKTNISICLTQNGINQEISDEFFEIIIDKKSFLKKTNTNGCLYVDKLTHFDFLEKEHFIKSMVIINGLKSYKGTQEIPIAINPWLNSSAALSDLRNEDITNRLFSKNESKLKLKTNINLENTNFAIKTKSLTNQKIYKLNYDFQSTPYLFRTDLNDQLKKVYLSNGSFEASFKLMKIINGQYIIIAQSEAKLEIQRGKLKSIIPFDIHSTDIQNSFSEIELFIKLTPLKNSSLKTMKGTIVMDGINSTKRNEIKIIDASENDFEMISKNNKRDSQDNTQYQNANVSIPKIDFIYKSNDHSKFNIDQALGLNLTKVYQIQFKPQFEILNTTTGNYGFENLPKGDYIISAYIINPKRQTFETNNISINDYNIIAETTQKVKLKKNNGVIDAYLFFKFNITNLMALTFENKILIKVSSIDGNIQSSFFARSFTLHSSNKINNTFETSLTGQEINQQKVKLNFKKHLNSFNEYNSTLKNSSIFSGTYKQFNAFFSTKNNFSRLDLLTLFHIYAKPPVQILRKFCKVFYKKSTTIESKYYKCLMEPKHYLSILSNKFIEDIDQLTDQSNVVYKGSDPGSLQNGTSYFSLYGSRSSSNKGVRQAQDISTSLGGGFWNTVGGLYLSAAKTIENSKSNYLQKNIADMYASFDRIYNSINKAKMEYNKLTLSFEATFKHCLTIKNDDKSKSAVICDTKSHFQQLSESWYFIGKVYDGKSSILADDYLAEDFAPFNQIIRGEKNFKRMQEILSNKDAKVAIMAIGGVDKMNALYSKLKSASKHHNLPYSSFMDNAFPGMIEK